MTAHAHRLVPLAALAALAGAAALLASPGAEAATFWTADFPNNLHQHVGGAGTLTGQLAITNRGALPDVALVQVAGVPLATLPVPPGETVIFPFAGRGAASSHLPLGVRVVAGLDTVVTHFSPAINAVTNDATYLLEQSELGMMHRIPAYAGPVSLGTFIVVVATEPGTTVTVDPTAAVTAAPLSLGVAGGTGVQTFALEEYDALTLHSTGDLTGSSVVADRPVAVFAGNTCTTAGQACDLVVEQVHPDPWAGRQFVLCDPAAAHPTFTSMVRIVPVANAPTTVTFTPGGTVTVSPPFAQFTLSGNRHIAAADDVHVVQVLAHASTITLGPGMGTGDPAMVLLEPVGRWAAGQALYSPPTWSNHVSVAVPLGATALVDGNPLAWSSVPGAPYKCGAAAVGTGTHRVTSTASASASALGHATYGSYWHIAQEPSGVPNECLADPVSCLPCRPPGCLPECVASYAIILPDGEFGGPPLGFPLGHQIHEVAAQVDQFAAFVASTGLGDRIGYVGHHSGGTSALSLSTSYAAQNFWLMAPPAGWMPDREANFGSYLGSDWPGAMGIANSWFAPPGMWLEREKVIVLITTGRDPSGSPPSPWLAPGLAAQVAQAHQLGVKVAVIHLDQGWGDAPGWYDQQPDLMAAGDPTLNPQNGLLYWQVPASFGGGGPTWDITTPLNQVHALTHPSSCGPPECIPPLAACVPCDPLVDPVACVPGPPCDPLDPLSCLPCDPFDALACLPPLPCDPMDPLACLPPLPCDPMDPLACLPPLPCDPLDLTTCVPPPPDPCTLTSPSLCLVSCPSPIAWSVPPTSGFVDVCLPGCIQAHAYLGVGNPVQATACTLLPPPPPCSHLANPPPIACGPPPCDPVASPPGTCTPCDPADLTTCGLPCDPVNSGACPSPATVNGGCDPSGLPSTAGCMVAACDNWGMGACLVVKAAVAASPTVPPGVAACVQAAATLPTPTSTTACA